MNYAEKDFANEYLSNHFSDYPLRIAEYTTRNQRRLQKLGLYGVFGNEHGSDFGINGAVDRDQFNGTVTELNKYCIKKSTKITQSRNFIND